MTWLSQAHHLRFFQFVLLKLYRENDENKEKDAGIGPFKKTWVFFALLLRLNLVRGKKATSFQKTFGNVLFTRKQVLRGRGCLRRRGLRWRHFLPERHDATAALSRPTTAQSAATSASPTTSVEWKSPERPDWERRDCPRDGFRWIRIESISRKFRPTAFRQSHRERRVQQDHPRIEERASGRKKFIILQSLFSVLSNRTILITV